MRWTITTPTREAEVFTNGTVVEAEPPFGYMIGWTVTRMVGYVSKKKNWTVTAYPKGKEPPGKQTHDPDDLQGSNT